MSWQRSQRPRNGAGGRASRHSQTHSKKPWRYSLIPDDVVDENMSLEFLLSAGPTA